MTLLETLEPKAPPIRMDESGTHRIGNSRVTLDSIIYHYRNGASPEAIQDSFDSLTVDEVYGAISYYLNNCMVVEEYLIVREADAENIRSEIERKNPSEAWRMRLFNRQQHFL